MTFKPKAGDIFLNKYEIVSLIGEGAFGSVYRARDIKLDRIVAIKFINVVNDVLERFKDELEAIKCLEHPNIVKLYDYDILRNSMPCMVMEFVNGREVGDVLCKEGPFKLERICEVILQVLDALVETHRHKIIHCDLKPENIMLSSIGARNDVAKLIDFGVASILSKSTDDKRSKLLVGTPQYMAPEQIKRENIGPWTDIYAIGLIFVELYTGQFVFDSDNPKEVLQMQLHKQADIPPDLDKSAFGPIIRHAIDKDFRQRYQDTKVFYDDLKKASLKLQAERLRRDSIALSSGSPSLLPPSKNRVGSIRVRSRASQSMFEELDDLMSYDLPDRTPAPAQQVPLLNQLRASLNKSNSVSSPLVAGTADVHDRRRPSSAKSASHTSAEQSSFDNVNLGSLAASIEASASLKLNDLIDSSNDSKADAHKPQSGPHPVIPTAHVSVISSQDNPVIKPHELETSDAYIATKSSAINAAGNAHRKDVPKKRTGTFLIVLLISAIAIICALAFARSLGLFDDIIAQLREQEDQAEKPSTAPKKSFLEDHHSIVPYSAIRNTSADMAAAAYQCFLLGKSPTTKTFTTYRIIGTPVDAQVFVGKSLVCTRTPCHIRVFNVTDATAVSIQKDGKIAELPLKGQNPNNPIFLVLDK